MRQKTRALRAFFMVIAVCTASIAHGQSTDNGIGYPSPFAALKALSTRHDVVLSIQNPWLIAKDNVNKTIWYFALKGNPVYPTAVKRQVVQLSDKIYIETRMLCGGTQADCDAIYQRFQALDQVAKQHVITSQP